MQRYLDKPFLLSNQLKVGIGPPVQGWPKPGKQGTINSERILANLDKTKQTGRNGQNWAKPGNKR